MVLKQKIDELKDEEEDLMQTFKAEKTALEKRVRELTYKLEVRVEDLEKKEVGTPWYYNINNVMQCNII